MPSPPKQLYVRGDGLMELLQHPCLAVVGSRKVSAYGSVVTTRLVQAAGSRGTVIVSGLALGVDGLAHKAALACKTPTIAVLPCGLDTIYPRTHLQLAQQILAGGGAIVSEYPEGTPPLKQHFIARNRLIAALGDALLITEAAEKSGTLHTAGFALDQGRDVLAVPGNITSPLSQGTNNLIRSGAIPVTCPEDVLSALNIPVEKAAGDKAVFAGNAEEHAVLRLLHQGVTDGDELLFLSKLSVAIFNRVMTMLEISGRIRSLGAGHWTLS